jgi:FlaA1/EpsC-like NDP-sugar epimerase
VGCRDPTDGAVGKKGAELTVRRTVRPPAFQPPSLPVVRLDAGILPETDRLRLNRSRIARFAGGLRGRHLLAIDLTAIIAAAYVALALRYDGLMGPDAMAPYLPILAILLMARVAFNTWFGLYSRGWRFASVPDLTRIVTAVVLGSVLAVAIVYPVTYLAGGSLTTGFPRSFWIGEMLITVAALGGVRFGIRATSEWMPRSVPMAVVERRRTLFYGAGRTGVLMVKAAHRKPEAGVVPVGFLDDDASLSGGLIANLRVFGGVSNLSRAVEATGAQTLLITMPSAAGSQIRRVVDAAMAIGLEVRTVPSVNDLLDGTLDAYRVRRVQVADLLRRPTDTEHSAAVREILYDKTVVITGAGGSIGSELARQVFMIGPRRLVLVDRAESPLYLVQRELETRRGHGLGRGELRAHLANVASRATMDRLIAAEKPDVIFHAAAYKHVPMMEEHPSDAVHVNIGGTLALLDAAVAAGVERFVLVSTDKAVRPTNVMGASKRVAEMLVADAARRTGKPYVSVRFGNVLGSTGSVVPIFQEQLEKSEPLSITHPDMTRYFMTIPEASWLILDAAALGTNGDLFVLDMGEPIRIVDLARDLVRLAGRDPDTQPMDIVGIRPGEKLHEELFYDAERVEPTAVAKVLRAVSELAPTTVRTDARAMLAIATGGREDELRLALLEYVGTASAAPSEAPDAARRPLPVMADKDDRVTVVSAAG